MFELFPTLYACYLYGYVSCMILCLSPVTMSGYNYWRKRFSVNDS